MLEVVNLVDSNLFAPLGQLWSVVAEYELADLQPGEIHAQRFILIAPFWSQAAADDALRQINNAVIRMYAGHADVTHGGTTAGGVVDLRELVYADRPDELPSEEPQRDSRVVQLDPATDDSS